MRLPAVYFGFVCALILSISPFSTQAQTLKIATLAPAGTTWMKEMRTGAQEIAERTDGRVKLKFYPGGIMGNYKSVLRKIRIGQLHGGAFTSGELAEVYPDINIYGLPFVFNSYDEVEYVRSRMDDMLRDGLKEAGFVVLGIVNGGFANMMGQEPLRSISDLKGKRVWLPEGDVISLATYKAAGIAPVSLPLADVYTGLQTGLVDSVATTPAGAIAFQWHTKVRYVTDVPLVFLIGLLAVHREAFEKLAPADQSVVLEVIEHIFRRLDRLNRQDNKNARQALIHQGIQFVKPLEPELQRWHEIAEQARADLESQGVYSAKMFGVLQAHLRAYRSQVRADGG